MLVTYKISVLSNLSFSHVYKVKVDAAMSAESSSKGSNSESSNGSPNQALILRGDSITDLTLFGSPAPISLSRTGTVRRVNAVLNKDKTNDDLAREIEPNGMNLSEVCPVDKYHKSFDSSYRSSLDSISEYKTTKSTLTSTTQNPSSLDSLTSEYTDYAIKSTTETIREDRTISPGSSYISWIESANSEYFGNKTTSTAEIQDVENKVGEWNNFWLNYSNARTRYVPSPYPSVSNGDRTGDELSDKSTASTQREFTDKNSFEQIILSLDEINEAIKCSQRITEILQSAIKRNEVEFDESKNDSYYSQNSSAVKEVIVPRERSFSYTVDAQDLQKQKQLLKPTSQSSSSSCINALLSSGVADILKRVINKRRDVFAPEDLPSVSRSSFSEWSITK